MGFLLGPFPLRHIQCELNNKKKSFINFLLSNTIGFKPIKTFRTFKTDDPVLVKNLWLPVKCVLATLHKTDEALSQDLEEVNWINFQLCMLMQLNFA